MVYKLLCSLPEQSASFQTFAFKLSTYAHACVRVTIIHYFDLCLSLEPAEDCDGTAVLLVLVLLFPAVPM